MELSHHAKPDFRGQWISRSAAGPDRAAHPAEQRSPAERHSPAEQLLADGSADLQAALTVGQALEQAQVTGLEQALDVVNPADVTMVYEHLLAASDRQLTAFETWLDG